MTVHEVLRRALRKGIEVLVFNWADGKVEVPTIRLLTTLEAYVGEDVDDHTRPDWIEMAQEAREALVGATCNVDRVIAHIVWNLNVTFDAEMYATKVIYQAIVESMLGGD